MCDLSNDNVIHIKDGEVEYIQFRKLLEYKDKINHCYTMRTFNKNYYEDDGENYKQLYKSLNLDYDKKMKIQHQIHSNFVEKVNDEREIHTNIDGLLTNKNGISLILRYADCTPILLYDTKKNIIGNIHSGWKGTAGKIGQNAVLKMIEEYGSKPEDIICCLGPCIQKCHFKVDEDVKNIFEDTFSCMKNSNIISIGEVEEGKQKYYIDTTLINRLMLEELGIKSENIIESKLCTVCNSDVFHSYRKDKEKSGRNAAIIGFLDNGMENLSK